MLILQGVVAFAQDKLGRDVALKFTKIDSDHYRILNLLLKKSTDYQCHPIPGNLPLLDLIRIGDYCLIVMPRSDSLLLF